MVMRKTCQLHCFYYVACPLFKSSISWMLTSAVLRWSRSPPIIGGGMQKAEGQNLLERGWSKFWPAGHWHAWSEGSPSRIPGIHREPLSSKGKTKLFSSHLSLFHSFIFLIFSPLLPLTPSPEQVGRPPSQDPTSSEETRTQ